LPDAPGGLVIPLNQEILRNELKQLFAP